MNTKYVASQKILIAALLISLVMVVVSPGTTMDVKALTGFVKTSPSNGATGQPTSVTLKWNAAPANPHAGMDTYYKYCYYKSGGSCSFQGLVYTTQYTISGLEKSTKYTWQIQVVYCVDASCTTKEKYEADNGTKWTFTTGTSSVTPPAAFTKTSPANNAVDVTSTVLTWGSSTGATSYQYCFSANYPDTGCAYLGGWKDVGNVTTYTLPKDSKLVWGSRYYWQIRASNAGGTTLADSGTWWAFTLKDLVGKTDLSAPTGVINKSTPTYIWKEVTGVTWYYLWVSNSSGNVFNQWYTATDAHCVVGGNCSVTPSMTLNQGNYTWWVQTYKDGVGYGPWSNSLAFNAPLPMPPDAATLLSPTGDIGTNYTPAYSWNAVPGSTKYYLWVSEGSTAVIKTWYTAAEVGCGGGAGTCSITPSTKLGGGAHSWWVQTYSSAGNGPWSARMDFNTTPPPVAVTVLNSPSGAITTNQPTYSWGAVPGSTWYYLWVDGTSGNEIQTWYAAADLGCPGGAGICSITPGTKLSAGAHTWKVQTWNGAGYGPWSVPVNFSTPLPPGKATLSEPNGGITTNQPTYKWNAVPGSTWYYLWVTGPSGLVMKTWYTAADLGCPGGVGTCSITPAITLSTGDYHWWIQTYSDAGYGPWSDQMDFSLGVPGAATLVSPTGVSANQPTYTWHAVPGSTWYYLWVSGPSGTVIQVWYTAADAGCGGGVGDCSVTPTTTLGTGDYHWWIQTYGSAGYGPWSAQMDFSVP